MTTRKRKRRPGSVKPLATTASKAKGIGTAPPTLVASRVAREVTKSLGTPIINVPPAVLQRIRKLGQEQDRKCAIICGTLLQKLPL